MGSILHEQFRGDAADPSMPGEPVGCAAASDDSFMHPAKGPWIRRGAVDKVLKRRLPRPRTPTKSETDMLPSLSLAFLEMLGSFLLKKAAQPLLDYSLRLVDEELERLCSSPAPEGNLEALTPSQIEFIRTLPYLQGKESMISRILSQVRATPKRGIVLLGPSGAGKSQIERRLRGVAPEEQGFITSDTRTRGLPFQGRRIPLSDSPGSSRHAMGGYVDLLDLLTGREPPEVAILVVAGGYLASSIPEMRATFARPDSMGRLVAGTTAEFVEACRKEETDYLLQIVDRCKNHAPSKKGQPIPQKKMRAIITVINKRDLWGVTEEDYRETVNFYTATDTAYGKALHEFRCFFGSPQQHSHDTMPFFTHGGGFHPDASTIGRALTPFHSAVDALLLRTLVAYRYAGGGKIG
jgi:energy-coupling factor transporter ATP-binding protein EcfA2